LFLSFRLADLHLKELISGFVQIV